jgi:hypothetical protein
VMNRRARPSVLHCVHGLLVRGCTECPCTRRQVLLVVLLVGLLIRVGLVALGVASLDLDAMHLIMFLLFWHAVLLL